MSDRDEMEESGRFERRLAADFERMLTELAQARATDARAVRLEIEQAYAEVARLRARMAAVDQLFANGPDTSCRTTWHDGMEYVEVPMADLRAAFDFADEVQP